MLLGPSWDGIKGWPWRFRASSSATTRAPLDVFHTSPVQAAPAVSDADNVRARCDQRLFELLLSLFTTDTFRRWIRHGREGERLAAELPGDSASHDRVVGEGFEALRRHGHIDAKLFDDLAARFEYRKSEIMEVAAACECASAANALEIRDYLGVLLQEAGYIDTAGIGLRFGPARNQIRRPIEALYVPLHGRPSATRAGPSQGERVPLPELLRSQHRLLLTGPPGSGKTTFLKHVAAVMARDLDNAPRLTPPWRTRVLGLDPAGPARIPGLLNLAQLAPLLDAEPTRPDDRRWLLDLLSLRNCSVSQGVIDRSDPEHGARCGRWEARLAAGEVILLLDGLDEVDEQLRGRVVAILSDANQRWARCPIAVTSRPGPTKALRGMGYHRVTVEPLRTPEIETFVRQWVNALPAGRRPEGRTRQGELLNAAIAERPELRRMAQSPVMLACLCVVHFNGGGLPQARARAHRAVFDWMLDSREAQRRRAGFSRGFAEAALTMLALSTMHRAEAQEFSFIQAANAVDELTQDKFGRGDREARREYVRRWLTFECEASCLVDERARSKLQFSEPTMQAYAAALGLARRDSGDPSGGWWPVVQSRLDELPWYEILELLPGCLYDEISYRHTNHFFAQLLTLDTSEVLREQARVLGHAERILEPMRAYDYELPERLQADLSALRSRVRRFLDSGWPLESRIAARMAYQCARRPSRPEEELIALPGKGVHLGKHPVTVAEFARFVEAGGYGDDASWDEEGRRLRDRERWTEPASWTSQQARPNCPVVGVVWYEARAYCEWLSRRTGLLVRLPRAEEWKFAASPDGRKYPWGDDDPTDLYANYGRQVGAPTPIGAHPAGVGKFGHHDLSGNVAEWCEDELPTPDWERTIGGVRHVLKGGSWWEESAGTVAANDCHYGLSKNRYDYRGFRIVVVMLDPKD